MKKNFTQLIAKSSSLKRYSIAVVTLLLITVTAVYLRAAVGITVTGGTTVSISADLAKNTSSPLNGTFTTLGAINFKEANNGDFASSGTVELNAPAGWEFYATSPYGISVVANQISSGAQSITAPTTPSTVTVNKITFTYSGAAGNKIEELTISGIKIRAIDGASAPETVSVTAGGTLFSTPVNVLSINHTHGVAKQLAFVQQPSNTLTGNAISPAVTVFIQDQFSNTITSGSNASANISIALGNNAAGNGTLNGTKTVTASGGMATFSSLSIDAAGTGYTLAASSTGLTSATSAAFNINSKAPTLTAVSGCITEGAGDTQVTITGTNFEKNSVVRVNGSNRATVYTSATQLQATILASDVTTAGNISIDVLNPAPPANNISSPIVYTVKPSFDNATILGETTVCAGKDVQYEAPAGFTEYNWSTSEGAGVIVPTANPAIVRFAPTAPMSGVVTITVSAKNSCGITGTTTLDVNVLPTPAAVISYNGLPEICAGSSMVLTATEAPSGDSYDYVWLKDGDVVGDNSNTLSVSEAGSYSVTITGTNSCPRTSDAIDISVNPLPVATILPQGSTTFCQGGMVTLEASPGVSWLWSTGETTQSINVSTSGDYTVQVTNDKGCTSDASAPVTVTVNPTPDAPTVSGGAVCDGGTVDLSASFGANANQVRWYTAASGGSPVATGPTYSPNVSSTTTFYATSYNTATTCESERVAVVATVNPLPTVKITPTGPLEFCEGNSVILEPTPLPDTDTYTYQWFNAVDNSQVSTDQNFVAYNSGDYYLIITNQHGCQQTSATLTVVVAEIPTEANITLQGSTTFCAESSVKLSANKAPSGQNYDYQWYKNDVEIPGATNVDYIADETGNYKVEVTNLVEGCSKISTNVSVTELPQPTAAITGGNQQKCIGAGNTTVFSIAGDFSGGTAQWISSNSNFVISNPVYNSSTGKATATVTATGTGTGNITLRTTNTNSNCATANNSVSLTVNPLPDARITVNGPTTFCSGGAVELSAIPGNYDYQWYKNGSTITTSGTDQSYFATTSGNYTVRVTNKATGCVATTATAVSVTVNLQPVVSSASATQPSQCVGAGDITTFNLTGSVSNGTAAWSVVNTSGVTNVSFADASSPNTAVTLTGVGTATVRLSSSSSVASCNTAYRDVTLTVNPYPIANAGPDQALCAGATSTRFNRAGSGNGTTVSWAVKSTDPGVTVSNLAYDWLYNSFVDITGVGSAVLTLTVTSNGCTTTDEVVYTVKPNPTVDAVSDVTYCNGAPGAGINFTSPVAGSAISWTSNANVGFGTSGNGNIPAFTAANSGTAPVVATVTVKATKDGCQGAVTTFKVIVNPTPKLSNIPASATVCSENLFSYNPTSATSGATFTWTRAAVTDISNPAVTTAQSGGISETLINTSTTDKTVVYAYTITANGCTNTQNVSVVVKPKPNPTFTGLAANETVFTGDGTRTLVGTPTGGTFSGPGVTGNTFNPCNIFNGQPATVTSLPVTIKYAVTVNGCYNEITKTVTVKRSTYKVVVTADPFPICRGQNTLYTAKVYRDATVIYPYKANEFGQPVDGSNNVLPDAAIPSVNMDYFTAAGIDPASIPSIIVANAWRFYQPIVQGGTLVNAYDITEATKSNSYKPVQADYTWTKNNGTPNNGISGNSPLFSQAGLSSTDWYAVQVTSIGGSTACPNMGTLLSQRMYLSEPDGYTMTIDPVVAWCNDPSGTAGNITLTATLGNLPGGWSTADLKYQWFRRRNGTSTAISGLITYTGGTTVSLTVPKSTFQNGDEVYIDFDTNYDTYTGLNSKCLVSSISPSITITINQPATITANLSTTSQAVCAGGTASYTISATGTNLQFTWYKVGSGTAIANGGQYSITSGTNGGATTSTLTISNVTAANGGQYYVRVNNAATTACATSINSNNAPLTVNPLPLARTVVGGPFCPVTQPGGAAITLNNSESGVTYRLLNQSGTVVGGPIAGNGGTLNFGTFTDGTYTVSATNTSTTCGNTSVGTATVTRTSYPVVTGELEIYWKDDMTRWEVTAKSDHVAKGINMAGFTYEWYTGTSDSDNSLYTTTTYPNNTISIPSPAANLFVRCVIKTPSGMCLPDVLMDNSAIKPLPVEIIYLTAEKQGYDVVLEWATAMEENNAGFEIQVSQDGKNFRKLDYVATKNGNSSQKQVYKYTDKENGKYGTRFYRLKQMDVDGKFEYFGPKVVEFGSMTNKITVYPNPFKDRVELNIEAETDGQMEIILSNSIGKQLIHKTIMVEKGLNAQQLLLESNLPRGVYFVTTRMGSETNHFKLLKQ